MKRTRFLAMLTVVVGSASMAQASIDWYEFSFSAADMLGYTTAAGADGSSAADNSLFNGARLRRDGLSGSGPLAARSYWASQSGAFTTWAGTTTDKLLSFNLWGLDGLGAKWGEDYKPTAWGTASNTAGWTEWSETWSGAGWGTPPAGYITETFIGWDATTYGDGVNFQDSGLASKTFTFRVAIDSANAWWGGATNGAPNQLAGPPTLTFWFGGFFDDDLWGGDNDYYIYEGNMVLEGRNLGPVPEPFTMVLAGGALVAAMRRRRRSS